VNEREKLKCKTAGAERKAANEGGKIKLLKVKCETVVT
jgi:hypothetical protein